MFKPHFPALVVRVRVEELQNIEGRPNQLVPVIDKVVTAVNTVDPWLVVAQIS